MSRRKIVSRSRLSENSTPANRLRRDDESEATQSTPLPPYEPPTFPLSASQKRALDNLRVNYDDAAFKKHIEASKKNITNAVGESNDRLTANRAKVQRSQEKARQQERDKTEVEIEQEQYAKSMDKKVTDFTRKGENAMRDLIDYGDELAMQDPIMTEVSENIAAAPARQPAAGRGRRVISEDGEGDEENIAEEAPAVDAAILSPVELLRKAKEDYMAKYTARSMSDRYVNNDYKSFKRTVHDAMHPGEDAPPVPHASTWFTQDEVPGSRNRRQRNSMDDVNAESDEEDDVIIASATTNLKCPLTLQLFVEPYSNNVCSHSFEKSAIIAYHGENGVAFVPPNQRRGQRTAQGPKQVKCPTVGCDAMLELNDFYDDQLLLRQVKRAHRRVALGMEDDDDAGESEPRGPEELDDEDDEGDSSILPDERRQTIMSMKRERQSRGPSLAPSHPTALSGDKMEEEDEDAMGTPNIDE